MSLEKGRLKFLYPHPLRLEIAGGLYHLTTRGDRREHIYHDEQMLICKT